MSTPLPPPNPTEAPTSAAPANARVMPGMAWRTGSWSTTAAMEIENKGAVAIAALERQTGTALLVRGARGVEPTPAGERLALHAEVVLAQLAMAEADVSKATPRVLRVGAFATAVRGLVAPALGQLRASGVAPDVEVFEMEPADGRVAMRAGDVDVVLVNHDVVIAPDADGPWRVVHLLDEPVLVALPDSHPLASHEQVDLRRLEHEEWIMQVPASPCQQLTFRACATAGFAPTVIATCADYSSIVALVRSGCGVSLVPRLAVRGLTLDGVVLRPARSGLARRINALDGAGERVGSTLFLKALREVAADSSPVAAR